MKDPRIPFDDSVRRLRNLWMSTIKSEFQHVYERFILSGQVQASDQINYTLERVCIGKEKVALLNPH